MKKKERKSEKVNNELEMQSRESKRVRTRRNERNVVGKEARRMKR